MTAEIDKTCASGWVRRVAAATMMAFVMGCGSSPPEPVKLAWLHGRTEDQVVTELGPAAGSFEFPVVEFHGELRIELRNVYPPEDPKSQGVMIKELRWRERDFHKIVWFHKVEGEWRALDSLKWHDSINF